MCFVDRPGEEGGPFLPEAEGRGRDLAGVGGGGERSLRCMSCRCTLWSRSAISLGDYALVSSLKSRRRSLTGRTPSFKVPA
ncbi:hypothetical protein BT93_G1639 [Corymbia citriodora subsp. variegata]|nr:hypothetical protein BT93_G1639 [Corymbia citriodora subsp. variegata]